MAISTVKPTIKPTTKQKCDRLTKVAKQTRKAWLQIQLISQEVDLSSYVAHIHERDWSLGLIRCFWVLLLI